ncbi:MAG: class I SAM-dependent methyltransferase [Candidatus Pacearchaeota archaeon]
MQKNQKQVWDDIAEEWHEFKQNPSKNVIKFLENKKGKILDIGSGSGRHLLEVNKENKEFYLTDFSEKMIEFAKKRAEELGIKNKTHFEVSEADSLPYKNNFFDAIICIATLHCLQTEEKRLNAISEIYRVLKPGSETLIEVWNKNSDRFKNAPKEKYIAWRDKGQRYYYLYEREEILEQFRKKGFEIKEELEHRVNISFVVKKPD